MDPKRTPNRPQIDSKWTPNGPQTDPYWTLNGPQTDPERTPNGPQILFALRIFDPQTIFTLNVDSQTNQMESIKALRPLKNQLGNIEHCEPHFSMSEKNTYTTIYHS